MKGMKAHSYIFAYSDEKTHAIKKRHMGPDMGPLRRAMPKCPYASALGQLGRLSSTS